MRAVIFFSFSGSKLPGYILPAVPAAVVFVAILVYELARNRAAWRNAVMLIAALTFGVAIALLIFVMPNYAETDSVKMLIQAADEQGYGSSRVLNFQNISHSAEFYAAGRLIRDEQGKQLALSSIGELTSALVNENSHTALVLTPIEYEPQLTGDESIHTEIIQNNGDLVIAAVSAAK